VFAVVGTASGRPIHLRLKLHEPRNELRLSVGRGEWGHIGGMTWRRSAEEPQGLVHVETGQPRGFMEGSGLVGQALRRQGRLEPMLQLDLCPELLAQNPLAWPDQRLLWDLNQGLPESLQQAALLSSSFALQWLDEPATQLRHWCSRLRPGGWLALAVPTSGSFPEWHQAAAAAGVPCSALALPEAKALEAVAG